MKPRERRAVDVEQQLTTIIHKMRSTKRWTYSGSIARAVLKKLGLLKGPGDSVEGMLKKLGWPWRLYVNKDGDYICHNRDTSRYYTALTAKAALRKGLKARGKG